MSVIFRKLSLGLWLYIVYRHLLLTKTNWLTFPSRWLLINFYSPIFWPIYKDKSVNIVCWIYSKTLFLPECSTLDWTGLWQYVSVNTSLITLYCTLQGLMNICWHILTIFVARDINYKWERSQVVEGGGGRKSINSYIVEWCIKEPPRLLLVNSVQKSHHMVVWWYGLS